VIDPPFAEAEAEDVPTDLHQSLVTDVMPFGDVPDSAPIREITTAIPAFRDGDAAALTYL
jgi:hypothetical protein